MNPYRISLTILLLLCLLPSEIGAQQKQKEINSDLRMELETFMENLRVTFQSGDTVEIAKLFDHHSLITRAESTGLFKFSGSFSRQVFTTGFESRIAPSMKMWSELFSWDKLEIQHIEKVDDRHVVVTARHWDDEQQVYSKNRWWLSKEDDDSEWRFYDLVDLDMNVRTSMMVALAATAAMSREPWLDTMMEMVSLIQQLGSVAEMLATVEGIEEKLNVLTSEKVPTEIRSFGFTLLALKYMSDEDRLDDALVAIEKIGEIEPKSYMRYYMQGNVFTEMDEHEKAVQSFRKYAGIYGWEADVCESISDVYMSMDKPAKSIEYARKGLADNKDSWGCLISLLVALPDDAKSQVDEYLTALDNNIDVMEIAIDYSIDIDDLASARHVYRLLQKHHTDSGLIDYYQALFDQ